MKMQALGPLGRWLGLALVMSLFLACSASDEAREAQSAQGEAIAAGEPISVTSTLGPVTASITVSPKTPLIGDVMSLTLEVRSSGAVTVTMPGKAEAFSRFTVEKYSESRKKVGDGETFTQHYRLLASRSGRLRIPPLRIVFVDNRSDSESKGLEQELLTDEIPIKVTPVLEGEAATDAVLRPIRGSLDEDLGPSLWQQYWWIGLLVALAVALLSVLVFLKRSHAKMAWVSPYERASVALAALEAEGLPDADHLDTWYVQLSSIVRDYLEGRFSLRAPELTTEEFLRVAQSSEQISSEHKVLLSRFLADCDRVKFAGYEPDEEESNAVLAAARKFLLETHSSEEERQGAS